MYSPYPVSRRGKVVQDFGHSSSFYNQWDNSITMFYKTEKYQDVLETGCCVLLLQISGTQPTADHMKKKRRIWMFL
jgi:hypothetical protein